jgi:Rrf2 family protein
VRLSEGVEWGLHAATLLAVLPPGATLPAARLAEYHGVPEAYLAKHLQALSRAGVVESVQGPGGGYRLARPPADVTVLDVVEAVDGEEAAFRCTEIRQRGPAALGPGRYRTPCAIHAAMLRADRAWRAELRDVSVASLLEAVARTADPQGVRRAAEWLQEVLS